MCFAPNTQARCGDDVRLVAPNVTLNVLWGAVLQALASMLHTRVDSSINGYFLHRHVLLQHVGFGNAAIFYCSFFFVNMALLP